MVKARLKELSIEEAANSLTHGFGLVLSLVGFVVLVVLAVTKGGGWNIASAIVYGSSLIILYGASTFYHSAITPRSKSILQLVDHCCIYLLIAGSYTPFALILLRDGIGFGLFAFAWIFAAVGIVTKVVFEIRSGFVSAAIYLIMGWVGIVAIGPIYNAVGIVPLILAVAGGLSYTLGIIFFGWQSLKHHHAIWHIFVLMGSVFHFVAIAGYVIPYTTNL
ncbi:MAG: hemolysin III family protein [Acidobacteria bacterium]|jgi:hemolysin III|nr:hemolysin III family protein [Acidobacteriota bacterium]MBP7474597.1 hemolysin III family protein [Pyrinomonadaceae bacterium]MBP9109446.1 hemolysin III family protein [Pyrinomonadaceae bacterium]